MESTALFPDIVGQGIAKKRLSFFLNGYNATGIISHLMFIAPKGCGKTTLAKAVAKSLKSSQDSSKPHKTFIEILDKYFSSDKLKYAIINKIETIYDLRKIRTNQLIYFYLLMFIKKSCIKFIFKPGKKV